MDSGLDLCDFHHKDKTGMTRSRGLFSFSKKCHFRFRPIQDICIQRYAVFTQVVGSTVTTRAFEVQGLERGNIFWIRVLAVRSGKTDPCSNQSTHVASI